MKAKIKSKQIIAENTIQIKLTPEQKVEFLPGQFLILKLEDPKYTDERGNLRYFSFVNSPGEDVTIATRVGPSAFKRTLMEMKKGDELDIVSVGGDFTLPDKKQIVFIAGGIGITPFMSMIRHSIQNDLDYNITLFYSNKNTKSTAFLDELNGLVGDKFTLILTMTRDSDWKGETSRINSDLLGKYLKEPNQYVYMVAGPPLMVDSVNKALLGRDVDKGNIKMESFSGY